MLARLGKQGEFFAFVCFDSRGDLTPFRVKRGTSCLNFISRKPGHQFGQRE